MGEKPVRNHRLFICLYYFIDIFKTFKYNLDMSMKKTIKLLQDLKESVVAEYIQSPTDINRGRIIGILDSIVSLEKISIKTNK